MNNTFKRLLFGIGIISFIVVVLFSLFTKSVQMKNDGLIGFVEIEEEQKNSEEPFWSQRSTNSSNEHFTEKTMNLESVRQQIDDALGVSAATVRVSLEHPIFDEVRIPWRDTKSHVVRVILPSSWVTKRISQAGSEKAVMESLQTIISTLLPNSRTTFRVVQDSPSVLLSPSTQESYAKQIVLLIGLFGVLFSSFIVDHRSSLPEKEKVQSIENPIEAARRIIRLPHSEAVCEIDMLRGQHQINVLRSIVAFESKRETTPIVQVKKQVELNESGQASEKDPRANMSSNV